MRTNDLAKTTLVDDGECLSFHSFSSSVDTSAFSYAGFELLVLPGGDFDLCVAGEHFALSGPQVLLLGPGLEHGWTGGYAGGGRVDGDYPDRSHLGGSHFDGGLAIRWPADLLGDRFLDKHQTKAISAMLERAGLAVKFTPGVVEPVRQRLAVLRGRTGFAIYLDLLALLHELSLAEGQPLLAALPVSPSPQQFEKKSGIEEAMAMMQANYFRPMTLEEMARKACMTKGSFCRSFRKKTGKTYAESLNEIRVGHICRLLADTTHTVSEIAYRAGYQNINHFHRHFKRVKGCTPLEWREGRR